MVSVIVANAVCAYFQPSIYDVVIDLKHLPYLPDIGPSTSTELQRMRVDDIMVTPVHSVCRSTTFAQILDLLEAFPKLRSFPVIDSQGFFWFFEQCF
jgi:hypothetical protein